MQDDEQAVRELIAGWIEASADGDADRLRMLMADDVVFLTPGQPPLRGKEAFMAAFEEGLQHYRIDAHSEVKEVRVTGDCAYCWSHLIVIITPTRAGLPVRRSGDTLSFLQKQPAGNWVLVRDANMLMPEPAPGPGI
ncbi:MAG: YybH family protein [Bacillota bacterium]